MLDSIINALTFIDLVVAVGNASVTIPAPAPTLRPTPIVVIVASQPAAEKVEK